MRDVKATTDIVYEIPCKGCTKTYAGESGRLFGTRVGEHKSEVDKIGSKTRTRAQRKASWDEQFKSPIAEHVAYSIQLRHRVG